MRASYRRLLIRKRREQLGIGLDEMSRETGVSAVPIDVRGLRYSPHAYDEAFISSIENEADVLEEYPFDAMKIVAGYLRIDLKNILWTLPGTAV